MSEAFLERLVPSESMFLKTNDLVVALKKVSAEDVKGLSMEEGSSKFQLPGDLGNVAADGSVNAQVVITRIIRNQCDLRNYVMLLEYITIYRLIIDPHDNFLPVGLIAQLEEHCTRIAEIKVRVPFRSEFFRPFFRYCSNSITKL